MLPRDITRCMLLWMAILQISSALASAAGKKEINSPSAPEKANPMALVGGRLIDGRGGPPVEDAVVVVQGTKILAVGKRGDVEIPAAADSLDVRGLSILPGLIDSHFHSANNLKTPVEYELHNGITSFRDPGHPFRFYDAVLQTEKTMPRVFLCGAHLDAHPPVWPRQAVVVQNANHARQTVKAHVARGASAIKTYFRLPLEHVKAACQAAKEHGVLVTAHLELVPADEAIRAGVRGIEHVTSFGTALAEPQKARRFESAVFADSSARRELRHRMWAEFDLDRSPRLKPLLALIVERKVFLSPTLALYERRLGQQEATEVHVRGFTNMLRFIGQCHEAGAKVVVGSHTSVPYGKNGQAYRRELELLVEAGFTPLEAITAATLHNAQFFGIEDRLGTLQAGKTADLILIGGDPSKQITAIGNVRHVMLNGNWVGKSPRERARQ